MNTNYFIIELAGISIMVSHRYPYIRQLCREYIVSEKQCEFSVEVSLEEHEAAVTHDTMGYSDGYIEGQCILQKMIIKLISYGVIMIHSAVVAVDGKAYVFAAHSGVGKTTHIKLWLKQFEGRALVVNGDKPLFKFGDDAEGNDSLYVCGSPWCGKEGLGKNITMPVVGICMLARGEKNIIKLAPKEMITRRFLDQVVIPTEPQAQIQTMSILNRIVCKIPFYSLECNQSLEAAVIAYEGMQ